MRQENAPVRATAADPRVPVGFPDTDASATGQLRIGQTYAQVRALLLAQTPPARFMVENRRFQLRDIRTEPNAVTLQALVVAPDRSHVETLRLRFTSKLTGQLLYFIHRDIEFRRATPGNVSEFVNQMAVRFTGSTWSMTAPGYHAYRQVFADGRMLTWGESQLRPELAGCFLLSGGPSFEKILDESSLAVDRLADVARCGGGIDADWRGDAKRFTVTLIDFPMYRDDRQILRRNLESAQLRLGTPSQPAKP